MMTVTITKNTVRPEPALRQQPPHDAEDARDRAAAPFEGAADMPPVR
jgi:hypothetical protein